MHSRIDRIVETITAPAYPAGRCYCCNAELSGDRRLLCESCADPRGVVALAARRMRAAVKRADQHIW